MTEEERYEVELNYHREILRPLVGGRVVQVDAILDDEEPYLGAFPVLVIECEDGITRLCYVERDEEGNGGGFLRVLYHPASSLTAG